MLLDELAKELVEVTSALVGGRTINVMDTQGVIVASTEKQRIGSFHQGAREAALTGKTVQIYRDQLEHYPGAKEGCNMPLRVNGNIIGVVGIYGDPDRIRDIAHLLEVYAAKYYQLESLLRPRLAESALRCQLLMSLLSPSGTSMSACQSMMESLDIRLRFPVYTAVISTPGGLSDPDRGQKLTQLLTELGYLERNTDIWGVVEERMVLLCSGPREMAGLLGLPKREPEYRVSLGEPSQSLLEIPGAYEQASIMDIALEGPVNDIADKSTRCAYMLCKTGLQEEETLKQLAKKLEDSFGAEETAILLGSVKAYYDCDHSVAEAAGKIFIHKNTLQYRVKRVLEVLELKRLPAFWQEYILRLLIGYYQRILRP